MNAVPNSTSLTRRKRLRCEDEASSYDQPEVPLEAERSRSPSRLPSPPPEDLCINSSSIHSLIDSQLVNDGLFPSCKLPPYEAPRLGGMYDYVVGSIDHWVEREVEFTELNVADDVAQSEESYHQVVQQLAVERVRMRRVWARASQQGGLEREVKVLTARIQELGIAAAERDNLRLELRQVELEAHRFTEEGDTSRKALDESRDYFQVRADQLKGKRRSELDARFVKGMRHKRDMVDLAFP
ncbi:hypothetical protein ZOSMA_36G00790 [Zostera marina]|uniref:Uncharacterized protein n=1 Tax=Zostera marina TaxID=29655 RepID=A0A0K9P8J3_ZOSMR|nr:hypothetical protein ZOSMA_36G00790 [Zostera marina]